MDRRTDGQKDRRTDTSSRDRVGSENMLTPVLRWTRDAKAGSLWTRIGKKHRINSHLINHCPASKGESKRAREQESELVSRVSEWTSEWSSTVLTSGFLVDLAQSGKVASRAWTRKTPRKRKTAKRRKSRFLDKIGHEKEMVSMSKRGI